MKKSATKLAVPVLSALFIILIFGLLTGFGYNFFAQKALTPIVTPETSATPTPTPEPPPTLPDFFPTDFPIPQNSTLESVSTSSGDTQGVSVIWRTSGKLEDAINFFEDKLTALKWKYETSKDDNSSTITFSSDKLTGFLGLATDKQETIISATMSIDDRSE